MGNANFGGDSTASGPSTNLGLNLNMGGDATPQLMQLHDVGVQLGLQ